MSSSNHSPVLEVHGAWKAFGGVRALEGVDFHIHRREIVALLGDNGAGKSTLIKAIAGVHRLDQGRIVLDGDEIALRSPADARKRGIETVYQDLALFPNLTAIENFFIGREITRPSSMGRLGVLRRRAMAAEWDRLANELQVRMKGAARSVAMMSGGQRQAVAVAKAVAFASRVVILDEPTAALGVRESQSVLELVRRLPERDISVIVVSHNLEHVMAIAQRAVVLRQGRLVGEVEPRPENHEKVVSMIVGGASIDGETQRAGDE
jgi:D-xylose transport system ATP-binding protein